MKLRKQIKEKNYKNSRFKKYSNKNQGNERFKKKALTNKIKSTKIHKGI